MTVTTAPIVTASPRGDTYYNNSPQSVTLTANEPATIYYTTDGTDPDYLQVPNTLRQYPLHLLLHSSSLVLIQ